jgi:hypothetical protein
MHKIVALVAPTFLLAAPVSGEIFRCAGRAASSSIRTPAASSIRSDRPVESCPIEAGSVGG